MAKPSMNARVIELAAAGRTISVSVSRVGTATRGSPRFLLLHGNPADMDDWSELVEHLGDSADVVMMDLPGFGRSGHILECDTTLLDGFADCARAAAARMGWEDGYYVVGHSHGAGVAMTLAARYPAAVAGLVLVSSIGMPAHASYRQLVFPGVHTTMRMVGSLLKNPVGRRVVKAVVGGILGPMFHPVAVSAENIEEQMKRFTDRPEIFANMALLARGDPSSQLSRDAERIGTPVLFLHGNEDRVVPVSHASAISSLVGRAAPMTFELVPSAGHMLHRTHAEHVARRAHDWLAAVRGHSAGARTQRASK